METLEVTPRAGFEELWARAHSYLGEDKLGLVRRAYEFALKAHQNQRRLSGEPFMEHPLATALLLAELHLDATALAAGLLHDVPEDCGIPMEEIDRQFGSEVAKLVDGVTKVGKIAMAAAVKERRAVEAEAQAVNLRRMFLAMAEDVRVVFIKLADRLHNLRTLGALPPHRRRLIAQETLDIYAPLAHRLGIWHFKWQLEDLAFRYLNPEKYREVAELVASTREAREQYVEEAIKAIRGELEGAGLKVEMSGRPKSFFSIYQKMEKYAQQGRKLSEIYDLLALRVLVSEVKDCYTALGLIHNLWRPIPGTFDDYIATRKDNMYQSLHTTVMALEGKPLEIQIRTNEMHRVAEYGVAAHWRYKEGGSKDMRYEERMSWLRQLLDWQRELSSAEFLESVRTDVFQDQVFVFTPKGDIVDLPAGSTPLDFAYRIHTDLGHRCIGSKVNGRLVSLGYKLVNGDTVEIMATKGERGPSLDWLNPDLGFVSTAEARSKIRHWFRRQARAESIRQGKELLEKELKRLGISLAEQENIATLLEYKSLEDFRADIGIGEVNPRNIAEKLAARERPPVAAPLPSATPPPGATPVSPSIQVMGVGDLLTHLAQCCHPLPGDDIIGYVTRARGVTIHRRDCPNIVRAEEKERLVRVDWGKREQKYPVSVQVDAWDRVGLLRDLSTVVSEEKVNIVLVQSVARQDGAITINLTLEITGIDQLSRVLARLEGVRGIMSATRIQDGVHQQHSSWSPPSSSR
ncbi:MAG: bifunctional (p)ppGpp synthetase/guanosine-3',5'-bis(diphosphate) 3'-pyrophosphohydrolase [Chloroflexi bacterium]|nr:bifunctional (p)ppGpp synthetase/guanosine-3',5'-bis(diphosphate) 3'-pyrophosphohydrolase [Chloroflexota bacterium]